LLTLLILIGLFIVNQKIPVRFKIFSLSVPYSQILFALAILPLFRFLDDGFAVTAAEPWIREKTLVLAQYLQSYTTLHAGKVNELIFIDLFADNGLYSLGARNELFAAPPLMALSLDLPITRYIFCASSQEQLNILKIRVNKYFRGKNVLLLKGKPEELLNNLSHYVPTNQSATSSSVFCLADSFSFDLNFSSVQKLAALQFNFLIPFCFALNDKLNYRYYLRDSRTKLDSYLTKEGADLVAHGVGNNRTFYKRLVQQYQTNMLALGYNLSLSTHKADSGLMELPTYHMGFFSKEFSTQSIRNTVEAAGHTQFELFQ
jgi:three-Cys-motif partner protein